MIFGNWQRWLKKLSRNNRRRAAGPKRARPARPRLEVLEGRDLMAGLYVDDNFADFATWAPGESIAHGEPVPVLILGENAFTSIQSAVNAARAGDTIFVGSGTYVEQLVIDKNLAVIEAEGQDAVIQSPASLAQGFTTNANNKAIIYVHDADGVTLRDLTVDGNGLGNSNYRFVGVAYYNAGGTIDDIEVKNITDTPFSGNQGGTGIYGYANDAASPHTLYVTGSIVHDYQKNGITMSGAGLTAHVTGNTITGAGPTALIAQNGIQFSAGATGTIEGNTVSGHRYTGTSNATSSGILLSGVGRVALTDNIVTDGQTGIYASQADGLTIQGGAVREQTWAIILYGADGARVSGGTISNSSDLADSMGVDVYQSADVTISDTTISGHAYGVYVEGGSSAAVNNNRITANVTGIHVTDGGSMTSVTENFITGNTGDGILITDTAGSVAPVFNNDLSGNDGLGINNQSATTVNASGNWWGTAAGVAAETSDKVDYSPWLTTGTDTNLLTPGFQGDFSNLTVNATSPRYTGQIPGNLQEGIDQVTAGGTVTAMAGTYTENVTVNKNLTLQSQSGRATTTIKGISNGALGTVLVTGGTTAFQLGGAGHGFTIIGIDNPLPGIESAAVYFQGAHSGARVLDNTIQANGDAGLMTEFGATITNFVIDGNTFSGQTFAGPTPGVGNQFTVPNVPRQLVVIGNGGGNAATAAATNITFTNNLITGTAGGTNAGVEQGNSLVTIDAANSSITGNEFAGTTTRFGAALRVRRPGTTISANTFRSGGMGLGTEHIFVQNNTTPLQAIVAANTFDKGTYVDNGSDVSVSISGGIGRAAAGDTLHALAGTYVENVLVNKSITLLGPNANVNPNTGVRGPEAIVMPATTDTDAGNIFAVTASDVIIKGFTINGDNLSLTGGVVLNGVDVDAANGISNADTYIDGLHVENNIIQNLYQNGVLGDLEKVGGTPSGDNFIVNNRIDNLPSITPVRGRGVLVANNFYADISGNVLTRVATGIQTNNFFLANPGDVASIADNQVDYYARGIFHNNHFGSASTWTISGNDITAEPNATITNGGLFIYSIYGDVGVVVTDNNVTGAHFGIDIWNCPTTSTITVSGGTLTGNDIGILVTNNDFGYGAGAATTAVLRGVTIVDSFTAGVYVDGGSAAVDNNRISDNGTGIHVTNGGSLTSVTENFITGNTVDGILITPTAGSVAPVFNNDLSGNGGLGINNQSDTTVNAVGNWWGKNIAAGVTSETSGSVDVKSFLLTGKDTSAETGFQGDFNAAMGKGNVRVQVVGKRLMITGDNLDNWITVEKGAAPNSYRVTGMYGTKINGKSGSIVIKNVTKGIDANLLGGNDQLVLDGSVNRFKVPGLIKVRTGSGDDVVRLQGVTGTGDLGSSLGQDSVELIDSYFSSLAVDMGNGATTSLLLDGVTVAGRTAVRGGNGADSVRVIDSIFSAPLVRSILGARSASNPAVLIQTGRGNDTVSLERVRATGRVVVDGGEGSDHYTNDSYSGAVDAVFHNFE